MKVCHVISMPTMADMGAITREIFFKCEGDHFWVNVWDTTPKADVYILHCFKNPKWLDLFKNYKAPGKIISLIHSSLPCAPSIHSDVVVTISLASQAEQASVGVESIVIAGFIDIKPYLNEQIDYSLEAFGRCSRYAPGKFHEKFPDIVRRILNENDEAQGFLISNDPVPFVHNRFYQNDQIKIGDVSKKIAAMKYYSIYADIHDEKEPFVDTFNIAMLEAMALGQAIILYGRHQPAMCEVLGGAGIIVYSVEEWVTTVNDLLKSEEKRRFYGQKARERAKLFSSELVIPKWNELLRGVYVR